MHSERTHGKFSPSQADRFFFCKGSANLIATMRPRAPSRYAIEGTQAHEIIEAGLRNQCKTATQAIDNSIYCLEDFDTRYKGAINEALDYINDLVLELDVTYGDPILFIEQKVNVPCTAAPGEADGHCDAAVYSPAGRVLYVIDYKHGEGVAKDVKDNRQAMQYAAGFLYGDNSPVDYRQIDTVTLVIIQPRAFHPEGSPREYSVTPADIMVYLQQLNEVVEDCVKPDAPLVPDTSYCNFCDARSTCPALEAKALSMVSNTFASVKDVTISKFPDPKNLDVHRLSQIKQAATYFNTWMNGVNSHIHELLVGGIEVPGFKLVEAMPRRVWYGDDKQMIPKLAALIGCSEDALYKRARKGITEIETMTKDAFKSRVSRKNKKLAAEQASQMLAYFTIKESSGSLSVASVDDNRPAVNAALHAFGGVQGILPPPPTKEVSK